MKAPVRVLLVGAAGRMGQTIVKLAESASNIDIVAQSDRGDALEPAMQKCDVVLDFSQADAIEGICRTALQHRPRKLSGLVIGTTGHSSGQRRIIEEAGKSLPIVFASNFSVGVNALFSLTRKAAEILGPEFDLEIVETHHRMKKDAPSGTARTLAEILRTARKLNGQVPIQSIREGKVVGDHTVSFGGPGERLELTHRASSREIFARGALRAAQWIIGKPTGLYSMQDVLGL
jgi:4-hydroxy-tetrahydrodipicolinate reductase